jgi:putative SOS response-associated peptidase YedK
MCVQFLSKKSLEGISAEYLAAVPRAFEWKPEVFPRYIAPVLIFRNRNLEVVPMHFGLIPPFERDPKPKKVFHNARSETLAEKPSFQRAYREARCLVPLQAFFESIWEQDPASGREKSHRVRFFRDGDPDNSLTAAGIWSLWRNPETRKVSAHFSIITREPPGFIEQAGHDRCPLFLSRSHFGRWLDPGEKSIPVLDRLLKEGREEPLWNCERV